MNIKEIRNTETNELTGYQINYDTHIRSTIDLEDSEVQEWIAEGNTPEPAYTDEELANFKKQKQIAEIKANCTAYDPVALSVNEVNITFNGGDSSASAISGAVELAQSLGETTVGIWDVNNKIHTLTLVEAFEVAKQIALKYRTDMYNRQQQITAIMES